MILAILFSLVQAHAAETLQIVGPAKSISVTVKDLQGKLQTHTVKINDPVFGAVKEYDGFLLNEVLNLAGDKADEIVFTAQDGYAPNVDAAHLKAHKAYLVFQEHGTNGKFAKIRQGKAMISPGPFYVVWEEGKKLQHEVPWPYQLVKIEAVDFNKKYPLVYPKEAKANEHKGFLIFKAQCIRCHSINLQGGDLGPELNVPKNVTEYWDGKNLREFIQNASSYRAKSKMPAFPELSASDIDSVVSYLVKMKTQKTKL